MAFTYLGLTLGTTRPYVQDFSPLICRIERRLCGISKMLSYQGRLILVNFVFFLHYLLSTCAAFKSLLQ
jgi:hypothetical protein